MTQNFPGEHNFRTTGDLVLVSFSCCSWVALRCYGLTISLFSSSLAMIPQIALLGAGIFVRTQYIPRLRELTGYVAIKAIWSRSEVCEPYGRDFSICSSPSRVDSHPRFVIPSRNPQELQQSSLATSRHTLNASGAREGSMILLKIARSTGLQSSSPGKFKCDFDPFFAFSSPFFTI